MRWWFFSFWWLIFPIMGFAFGAFGMWMGYLRQRHMLELMKTYAAQGKDPAEVAKLMSGASQPGAPPPYGPDGWGGPGWGGPGWGGPGYWGYWGWRRPWGYWGRWGPYRQWHRFVIFLCLAVGFGIASQFAYFPGTEYAFTLVAIIMGVLAVGALILAILGTVFAANMDKHEK
ncbi:MAG: hypothetical protein ACHP7N_06750 [Caulobacterales bacterium]